MTLKFISQNSFPMYLALSSDIVDSSIDGCSVVGGTVFLTDTGGWYIVKDDLTLKAYSFPEKLSEIYATLQVRQGTFSQVVSDESHYHVHDGTLWSASHINTNIAASGTLLS